MKGQLKIIIAMIIFGSIGVFVKRINLTSLEIAFLRALIGSVFLLVAGIIVKQKISWQKIKANIYLLVLSGAAIGFNWIMLFQGYKYTTISNATLAYYFAPVFALVLSPIVLKEKLTTTKIACIPIAIVGLFLVININNSGGGNLYQHTKGIGYALGGAGLYASVVLMNKLIKGLTSFEITLIQLIVATIILLPSILIQGGLNISGMDGIGWFFIIILGVIHTGIGYLLYFTSVSQLRGQSVAMLSYIDPIAAIIISALVFGETMNIIQLLGGILILGSTVPFQKD
ncbi:MAG TPA: EamA family transporter [Epulopiscium sp.]|nr:EamA family transporter [Candidatus Epulonipiscium sp.]